MKPNSLVVYKGGQCEFGKSVAPLELNKVYTVLSLTESLRDGSPMIYLKEMMHYKDGDKDQSFAFVTYMFEEVEQRKIKRVEFKRI